jgi:hypothetical protein
MDFSKWRSKISHEIEYLVFHNYFFFSLLMYRCLLPSSVTVKMENARYATNDDTPL